MGGRRGRLSFTVLPLSEPIDHSVSYLPQLQASEITTQLYETMINILIDIDMGYTDNFRTKR